MCQHGMCRCLICHGTKASLAGMEQRISSGASGSRGALKRGLLPGFGGGGGRNVKTFQLAPLQLEPEFRGAAEHEHEGKFGPQAETMRAKWSANANSTGPLTARDRVSLLWFSWFWIVLHKILLDMLPPWPLSLNVLQTLQQMTSFPA
jgi:hypothetical protein